MESEQSFWGREPRPIDVVSRPFQRFAHQAASGGIVLLAFTIIAMVWANSPWADSYFHILNILFFLKP